MTLTEAEALALEFDWTFWGRPAQIAPPGDWIFWLVLAGRGWGKTRTGGEFTRDAVFGRLPPDPEPDPVTATLARMKAGAKKAKVLAQFYGRGIFIGRTAADVRDVMVEGESGILAICPKYERPLYQPSKRRLVFPNGAVVSLFSAEQPEALRGPQSEFFWADELAAWEYQEQAWSNLMFGFRLGRRPRGVITTTPRPTKLIRDLIQNPKTYVTRGSTYDNIANLAEAYIAAVIRPYEGTRLGAQELYAQILDDVPGALWKQAILDTFRYHPGEKDTIQDVLDRLQLDRIVVAIDPAATSKEGSDETGIVVCGRGPELPGWPHPGPHGYVLEDLSGRYKPHEWAKVAVDAYKRWKADCVVAETNNGGEMVEETIRQADRTLAYRAVTASRGKAVRAEPVSLPYEQGRVHHVGTFSSLESQMIIWVPGQTEKSPDRVDALVWAMTDLLVDATWVPATQPNIDLTKISIWTGGGRWSGR